MPRTKRTKEAVDPRKRPRQRRSQSTVDAILEGAAQVLERDGYATTTTDLIAERAGVSIGTLYQYFPNKDAILLALTERHAREAEAVLEPLLRQIVDDTPPLEAWLQRFVRACVDLNGRRPRLHQILFEETPFPTETLEEMYRNGDLILDVIERYLARAPGVRVANPRLAAYLAFRALGGVIYAGAVRRPSQLTMEQCGDELVVLLCRYLTGPPTTTDLVARFEAYANDFERSYADGDWTRLARYFAADAVYECRSPPELAFRVEGRDAILARFDEMANAFDRRFDSRAMTLDRPQAKGTRVSVNGLATYTVADAPALRLPFSEVAEYRGGEIVHLEDASSSEAMDAVMEWMACYGAELLPPH